MSSELDERKTKFKTLVMSGCLDLVELTMHCAHVIQLFIRGHTRLLETYDEPCGYILCSARDSKGSGLTEL